MALGVMLEHLIGKGLLGASNTRGLTFVNVVCVPEQQVPPPPPPPNTHQFAGYWLFNSPTSLVRYLLALSIIERWNAKSPSGLGGGGSSVSPITL